MNDMNPQKTKACLEPASASAQTNRNLWPLPTLAVVWYFIFIATITQAEGFRNPPPGTFNLGRAGGRIAQIDDSSAVQQNPANLVDVAGTEFQFTPTIVYISADFKSPNGQSATSQNPWKALPNVFGSTTLFDGKIAIGFGLTAPYGIGSEWDEKSSAFAHPTGVLRYQAPYFAELQTINLSPAVSFKLGDRIKIGEARMMPM